MPITYNEILKAPGAEIEYTPDQVKDLVKSKNDVFYFSKFVKIISLDKGIISYDPYDFQREMITLFDEYRYCVILSSRQSGKSTTVGIYALWYAIFNENKFIGIVSNKASSSKEILHRIKIMYEQLPFWMKPGVIEWNKNSVEFENGTRIQVSATSESAFRGKSINFLICLSDINKIKIRDKNTGEIEELTMSELEERLENEK